MRELVDVIDSHVELVDLEVTSNLRAGGQPSEGAQLQSSLATQQPPESVAQVQSTDHVN